MALSVVKSIKKTVLNKDSSGENPAPVLHCLGGAGRLCDVTLPIRRSACLLAGVAQKIFVLPHFLLK
jgi:hypothetical protein